MKKTKYFEIFDNYLYSTRTKAIIKLSEEYIKYFIDEKFDKFNETQLKILIDNGFIIDESFNEYEYVIDKLNKFYDEHISITFMPTMQCNFSCKYCYETKDVKKLDSYIYDKILNKIYNNDKIRSIRISWFGGEPSLLLKDIKYFMTKLNQYSIHKNIRVTSDMTTNFYLLNFDNFKELIDLKVNNFQVTLDGNKDIHNFYRPLCNGLPTYKHILKNLIDCHNSNLNFKIMIRTNYDASSKYDDFYQEMKMFEGDERFSFVVHAIEGFKPNEYACDYRIKEKREQELLDLIRKNRLNNDTYMNESQLIGPCYANLKNNIIINNYGIVLKCTIKLNDPNNKLGKFKGFDIKDSFFDSYKYTNCPDCRVFPICLGGKCKYALHNSYIECMNESLNKLRSCLNEKVKII